MATEDNRVGVDPLEALDNGFDDLDTVIEAVRAKGFPKQANELVRLGASFFELAQTILEA